MGDSAQAAVPRIRFHIDPKPYSEALLDVAQQANVTLIGASACVGTANALSGSYTLEEALGVILAHAPCAWRVVAPAAVDITASTPAPARAEPPTMVSELLVTATKRVESTRQIAVAVTAVSGRQLRATAATDIGDASGQLTGVQATNLGPGRNKLLLRGLSDGAFTGRARSTVGTYLDDIPLNYNAPDPDLRLVDVERVEVARGPQGALYGAGSLSGIYRIVTRKPDLEHVSSEVRATGALTENGSPSHAIEGYLNMPLLEGTAGFRLAAYREIMGGYLDDTNLDLKDVDRTERRGVRAMLLWQPNDAWTITITGAGQHLRSDDTHYTSSGMGLKRANRIAEPHVNDISLATATVRRSWGWGELTSSTGFIRHAYGSIYDGTDVQQLYTSFARTSAYTDRTRTRMIVQDLFLTSRGSSPFQWLAGLYGSDTSEHSPTEFLAITGFSPTVMVYGDDRRDRIRELAVYGEASYAFAPDWTLAVGGRLFTIQTRTKSDVVSERFDPRSFDRETGFNGFSPKVSLQWEFSRGDLAYAVMSEGHRSGGINSGGARALPRVRETYAPDRLRNYEIGLKLGVLDEHLQLNTAAFFDVWKDIQTDQFRASGIPYTTNAGDAEIAGVEAELAVDWANGLLTGVNGRYSHTKITRVNLDFATRLADGLPGAPPFSAGFLASYERPVWHDWLFRVVGETSYVGPSRVTFNPEGSKMGGYVRTSLTAEISRGGLGLQMFLTNLTNEFSDTFAYGNPFSFTATRQVTPQRPRTIGLTLTATY